MKIAAPFVLLALCAAPLAAQSKLSEWPQHSEERPHPRVVTPGAVYTIAPPNDATILFGGASLDKWASGTGMRSSRPGSASAFDGTVSGFFEKIDMAISSP